MSTWSWTKEYRERFPIVIVHEPAERGCSMRDTFHRKVVSGPEERWPESDPRHYDRANPEPCDDAMPEDGCRQRDGHMGVCTPTPELARFYYRGVA